jgi:hypothetical protein
MSLSCDPITDTRHSPEVDPTVARAAFAIAAFASGSPMANISIESDIYIVDGPIFESGTQPIIQPEADSEGFENELERIRQPKN